VPIKSTDQQALLMLHRKRSGEALQIVCAQTWEHR
jgi:hypothetical protein